MKIEKIQQLIVVVEGEPGYRAVGVDEYVEALMADHDLDDFEKITCNLLLSGMQPKEIASAMRNSYGVMKHRLAAIYRKFDVRDYRELFARFFPVGTTKHRITEALRQGAREAGMA